MSHSVFNVNEEWTPEQVDVMRYRKTELMEVLFRQGNLSTYGPNIYMVFTVLGFAPPSFCVKGAPQEAACIDVTKAYPSYLYNMGKIPVFNQFDVIRPFSGSLEDYSVYIIYIPAHKVMNLSMHDKMFIASSVSAIYGFALKRLRTKEYKVVGQITPSKLRSNPYRQAIQNVLTCNQLSESRRKELLNHSIGSSQKSVNRVNTSMIFKNHEDAMRCYYSLEGGNGREISDPYIFKCSENNKMYVLKVSHESELINGNLPVRLAMYDSAKVRLAEIVDELEKAKVQVLGVRTDCVFIHPKDVPKAKKLYPLKGDAYDGCSTRGTYLYFSSSSSRTCFRSPM